VFTYERGAEAWEIGGHGVPIRDAMARPVPGVAVIRVCVAQSVAVTHEGGTTTTAVCPHNS